MEEKKRKISSVWILAGILLVVLIGGGIYVYRDLQQTNAAVQARQTMNNPAMRAATGLMMLQRDPKLALTQDQKTQLIPIIQDLINTKNPSSDYLQQKAAAINAVLTDEQKAAEASRPNRSGQGRQGNWNGQRPGAEQGDGAGQGTQGGQGQGGFQGGQGGFAGGQRQSGQFNPQNIYQRVMEFLQQ